MFCRHGRREDRCAVCSREAYQAKKKAARSGPARRPAAAGTSERAPRAVSPPVARRGGAREGMRVRKLARPVDDGWRSDLAPGLRGSRDAVSLLDRIVAARARLDRLRDDPVGPYAEARELAGGDEAQREEAAWLLFQVAYYGPLDGTEPFSEIDRLRVAVGEELPDEDALRVAAIGPRGAHAHDRGRTTLEAYRAWAARAGGQLAAYGRAGGADAARRFDGAYRSLSLAGLDRGPRYELLLTLSAAGLLDVEPWSLLIDAGRDPVSVAAKRAFLSGDAVLLQKRAGAFGRELDLRVGALDLGLSQWNTAPGTPGRRNHQDGAGTELLAGVPVKVDYDEVGLLADALGVPSERPATTDV